MKAASPAAAMASVATPSASNVQANKKTKNPKRNSMNDSSRRNSMNASARRNTMDGSSKRNNTPAPAPYTGITPSHVAKEKLNEIYETLPDKDLTAATRTYTSRLHQLRLQRDHRRGTYERLTDNSSERQYVPASCTFKFNLGASPAAKRRDDYVALQKRVDDTLQHCQETLAKSIAQLQLIEIEIKEEEIAKTFCEGLSKIGVAFVNHHRDKQQTVEIANTMQSQRLADRLVEMVLEKNTDILEFSYLMEKDDPSPLDHMAVLKKYYQHIERPMPTHSRLQNRDAESSPYNEHYTEFLEGLRCSFEDIVKPCFHTAWREYLLARDQINNGVMKGTNDESITIPNNTKSVASGRTIQASTDNKKTAFQPKGTTSKKIEKESGNLPDTPTAALPTPDILKRMVQAAVSEETQALRDTIRTLQDQLWGSNNVPVPPSNKKADREPSAHTNKKAPPISATSYAAAASTIAATVPAANLAISKDAVTTANNGDKDSWMEVGSNKKKNKQHHQQHGNVHEKKTYNQDLDQHAGSAKKGDAKQKHAEAEAKKKNIPKNHSSKKNSMGKAPGKDANTNAMKAKPHPKNGVGQDNANGKRQSNISDNEKNGKVAVTEIGKDAHEDKSDEQNEELSLRNLEEESPKPTAPQSNDVRAMTMNSMHDSTTILFGSFDTTGAKKWG